MLAPIKMGHTLDDPFQAVIVWSAVANFLQQHLDSVPAQSPEEAEKTFIVR